MPLPRYIRSLQVIALLRAATLPLILMGGLVRSRGAGMLGILTVLKCKPADIASAHVNRLFQVIKIESTERFAASPFPSTRKEQRFLTPS